MIKNKEYIKEAARHLKIADNMTFITFPIVNERRLIIKIFEEIAKSIKNMIYAVVFFEIVNKNLLNESNKNIIKEFIEKSKNYDINLNELKYIKEILNIEKKHLNSSMEFVKKEKLIMMSDKLETKILTIEDIKDYLDISKTIFLKISSKIKY